MTDLTFGSVCSGIEAASVAWEPLGMRPAWFAEIEKFPAAVLAHHWPGVTNFGDMCLAPQLVALGMIEAPDVLVGGTPCQAFSVAGLRGGLDDARGQLTLKFVELANEIDKKRPCVIVWENVPGVLSDRGNAFGHFLAGLCGEDEELKPPGKKWANAGCVFGPQRAVAWRVLDAQYFGVAQRRRRVFVVASAREGFDPGAVLFESEGVRRDIAPSRETSAVVAALTANGVGTCGADDNQAQAGHTVRVVHGTQDPCTAEGLAFALGRNWGAENAVLHESAVRRLTPTECERLQGFPDDHTSIAWRNKSADECPDGPRYKAIGNSMAVPVVRWIGERLKIALARSAGTG